MFENIIGQYVKIVFKDVNPSGKEFHKVISGKLNKTDDKFLYVKTYQGNDFIVSTSSVVSVKELRGVG